MEPIDTNILTTIIPRLIPVTHGDPILGLEIIKGPYTGVTFSFKRFVVSNGLTADGMVPTKFETEVHSAPEGFHVTEDFDLFCGEVLLAWLHHISLSNFDILLNAETKGLH